MKKIIISTLIVVIATVSMSFITIEGNSEKEINKTKIETLKKGIPFNKEILNSSCWWDETFGNNLTVKRGVSCGSETSLKIWFTNPYSYSIRVAFYLRDYNGNLGPNAPYTVTIKPGETRYHHHCYSNGQYTVAAARSGDYCAFPILH